MTSMQAQPFIPVNEFCASHDIEMSFVSALKETGLIEMTTIKGIGCIHASQLKRLEKITRFHYELDINLEGIETIIHLLERMYALQADIKTLKNRLRLYEDDEC